jgi:S-adenosylmethionine synthetase
VTASYGHFGRESYEQNGIEYFTREKLDYVDILKEKCMIQTAAQ